MQLSEVWRQTRIFRRNLSRSRWFGGTHAEDRAQAQLAELFRQVNLYLRRLSVDYWLAYGTLLGYYRESALIRGDHDVDFGVPEAAYPIIWAARQHLPAGFQMRDTSFRHGGPKLYVVYKDWEADIYFFYERVGKLCPHLNSPYINETKPFPIDYIYPVQPACFLGEPTYVPNDPLAYLEHTYYYIGAGGVKDPRTGYWSKKATL